jgi:phospholipase C
MTTFTRRRLVAGAAGAALSLSGLDALAARAGRGNEQGQHADLPLPDKSGIDHVIVVMMENRSFDHFLGWLPRANGRQAGLAYPDTAGRLVPTYPLAPDFTGCGHRDPDHSYDGGRVEFDDGRCDGWLRVNDVYSIGYYTRRDLGFFGQAAPDWTVCDNYFAAILAPTFPNRIYQHAGVTDRTSNTFAISTLPTIWDRLAHAGLEGRYYYGNLPFVGLWGAKYLSIARPFNAFLSDCAAGALPQVAYVDPTFTLTGEEGGTNDDHPHADIRAGESFLARIYDAVTSSPGWDRTLLVINFDEWGGFFDHVPPDNAPDVQPAYQRRGFRVPLVLISPLARRRVVHDIFDHTSVLRLIEWRWNLSPLSVRDATAANLAQALDFERRPRRETPKYAIPPFVSTGCTPPSPAAPTAAAPATPPQPDDEWNGLADLARAHGFELG